MEGNATLDFVFLYTRLPDYFWQCLKFLVASYGVRIFVVAKPADIHATFRYKNQSGIQIVSRDDFDTPSALIKWLNQKSLDAIYVAGWTDSLYLETARYFGKRIPVILGMDNPWLGTLEQKLGSLYKGRNLRKVFTHIWVPGAPQYAFARQLGFGHAEILTGLYCADLEKFTCHPQRMIAGERVLFYCGRFVAYKQPDMLVEVFDHLVKEDLNHDWTLHMVGSGPLEKTVKQFESEHIRITAFVQPKKLVGIYHQAAAFCLPSLNEHWGVVVHEAAASGLPLILSDSCFAGSQFLISGFNGWQFRSGDAGHLKERLIKLFDANESVLRTMGARSQLLASTLDHERWAVTFLSILH